MDDGDEEDEVESGDFIAWGGFAENGCGVGIVRGGGPGGACWQENGFEDDEKL